MTSANVEPGVPLRGLHLDELLFENAAKDDVCARLREASKRFRFGLNDLFFEQHSQLKELIRLYGVF